MTNKLQLFQGTTIRTVWDREKEEWFFSVADVCNVLSGSQAKDPGAYWRKLKQRLKAEGSEIVTNCHGLKLQAADGNGRTSRLLEKWFLAQKLGQVAWAIPSEKLYFKRKKSYYENLHFRDNYSSIDYARCIPFLCMLPMALNMR